MIAIIEHGALLFHLAFPDMESSPSAVLQANLVSALVSFTTQVKEDSLESIHMSREKMLFHRQRGIIFVLVVDAEVRPDWVERSLKTIHEAFCQQYPSVPFDAQQSLVFDVTQFDPFKVQTTTKLQMLDTRLQLILALVHENLLTEDEAKDADPIDWAPRIAERLLQRTPIPGRLMGDKTTQRLHLVDTLLDQVEGGHIYRSEVRYILECDRCRLCEEPQACFFADLLEGLLTYLDIDMENEWDATNQTRTITIHEN